MEKILPVHKPYVSHTPESSFLFSILQDIPTADEWICSRLLSMVVRKENVHDEFSMVGNFFAECPFFHIVNVKDEIVKNVLNISFSDCIENAINNEYYVSAMVNTKFIHNYKQDSDFLHHIHIYGCDTTKQKVCIADHFQKGKFSFEECSFSEINHSRKKENSDIAFVKLLPDVHFDLTSEMIISIIEDHMNSVNLFSKYNLTNMAYPDDPIDSCFFGLDYYTCLVEIVREGRFPYKRPIVLIHEHTKILKMLLIIVVRKYISKAEQLLFLCDDLIKNAELLRNYYMKVLIINNFNELDYNEITNLDQIYRISELLISVMEKEKYLLGKVLFLLAAK